MNRSNSSARSRKSRRAPTLEPHPMRHRAIAFCTRRQGRAILPVCRPLGKTPPHDFAAKPRKKAVTPNRPFPANHRSKPGGHPGHDKSRRLSLPPVVAPEMFETMVFQAIIDSPQETCFRDLPVSEGQVPDGGSFCGARRRSQGRFIVHVAHAKSDA